MKRLLVLCCAFLWAVGLAGCSQKEDRTVVWQATLPQSGVRVELSNCGLLAEEPVDYVADHHNDAWEKLDAVMAEGVPVLTFYGVQESQVNLAFLMQVDTLFCGYDKVYPQSKLDYVLTKNEDGSLSYRFDTVTPFAISVTTDSGTDLFALLCEREL